MCIRDRLSPFYPLEEVRKRYKDSERSQTFIDRSILIADCCLALKAINATDSGVGGNTSDKVTKSNTRYTYLTEADYIDPVSYTHLDVYKRQVYIL